MSSYRGSSFYDNLSNFQKYMDRRNREQGANETLERPVIQELLGNVNQKKVLDIGCGDGRFGLELIEQGCTHYTGIDGSTNMIDLAKEKLQSQIDNLSFVHTTIEEWDYPINQYDIVVSRLVIHYIEDVTNLFHNVYSSLRNHGRFIFSIEHPVITSSYGIHRHEEVRQDWIVDNYFRMGPRRQEWLGGEVIKQHRTLEEYYRQLKQVGFVIKDVRESMPNENLFTDKETYERRMRIPLFLFLSVTKED
jgi:ubiquinone/menaquinone biosynthesis C-methylase UbiE